MEAEIAPEQQSASPLPQTAVPHSRRSSIAASVGAHGNNRAARLLSLPLAVLILTAALAAAILISLTLGAVHIQLSAIVAALLRHRSLNHIDRVILLDIRLPRILASAVVGAALAVSGLLFQGLFRNPMADPYIIGSSGGATIGACFGIFFFPPFSVFGFSATAVLAFVGSVLTLLLVYRLARSNGRTQIVTLLLTGFGVSAIAANMTYFFEVFDPTDGIATRILQAWQRGIIATPPWQQIGITSSVLTVALLLAFPLMRRLNTLALGDEYAQQLGLSVESTRIAIIVTGSLLTAAAITLGGLITFAGLIVPHIARLLLGPDNTRLLPATALGGALFLVVADTLARTLFAPSEIPVGILMALIGGPFFLYLLRKTRRSYAL